MNGALPIGLVIGRHYTNEEFSEAYSCYQRVLDMDRENINANYQLAIMTFKRQGCGRLSKKKADRMTKDFLRKALSGAEKAHDREKVDRINSVLYFLE